MHELAVRSLSLPAEALLEQLSGAPHAVPALGCSVGLCCRGRTPPTAPGTSAVPCSVSQTGQGPQPEPSPGAEPSMSIPAWPLSSTWGNTPGTRQGAEPTLCHSQPSALPQKYSPQKISSQKFLPKKFLPQNPGANLGFSTFPSLSS